MLAFGGTMPLTELFVIAQGQIVFKALVTVISIPGIYLVSESQGMAANIKSELVDG